MNIDFHRYILCDTIANALQAKTWRISQPENNESKEKEIKLECGPMLNVMAALPNIGGALCSTPQSLADAHY